MQSDACGHELQGDAVAVPGAPQDPWGAMSPRREQAMWQGHVTSRWVVASS